MKNKQKTLFILITALLLILSACGGNAGSNSGAAPSTSMEPGTPSSTASAPTDNKPAQLVDMTIAFVGQSVQYAPIYYALEKGWFEKYGINLEIVNLDPAASVAALISGSTQIVHAGPNIIDAAIKTDKVKAIATYGELPMWVYTKDLTTLDEIKGTTMASTTPGGVVDYAGKTMIYSKGLETGKDVQVLYTGNGAAVLVAISEGQVQSGILTPPFNFQADQMGIKNLVYVNELPGVKGKFGVIGLHQPFADKYPEAVEGYMKAYSEGSVAIRKDIEGAKAATLNHTQLKDDEAFNLSFDLFMKNDLWPIDMHLPETEVEFLLKELEATNPAAKTAKVADVLDNRYADAAK